MRLGWAVCGIALSVAQGSQRFLETVVVWNTVRKIQHVVRFVKAFTRSAALVPVLYACIEYLFQNLRILPAL